MSAIRWTIVGAAFAAVGVGLSIFGLTVGHWLAANAALLALNSFLLGLRVERWQDLRKSD